MLRKASLVLGFLLAATFAHAQSVLQSGTITPGHVTKWISNGVVGDGGTASNGGLSSLGVTNNGGPGICVNSGPQTGAGYNQLCLSAATSGAGKITLQNYGTATAQNLDFVINGNTITVPSTPGSTFATVTGPFTNGDIICTNAIGVLYDCGFSGGLIPPTGTSGGIPYYAGASSILSSALLAANKIVLGGGAGTAPATTANAGMSAGVLTLGQAGSVLGSVVLSGSTSGTASIVPQAAAGTTTLTLPNASGTFAISGTSPIVLNATTGALTCPTCATSSGGGAITGTAPISVSAAGVVSITGTALTKTDDTNVTLTLGGSPTTALVTASSLTLGWTGQLALTRGGTAASLTASNGGLVYSTASALAILSGTATANQIPMSGSSAAPSWSTATYPPTTTINQLLYSSSANTIAGLATTNGGLLNASSSGVPSMTVTPTLGVQQTTRGSLTLANTAAGAFGATLQSSNSATAATTITLPVDAGTSGYVLSTNGAGVTSWINPAGGGTVTTVGFTGGLISVANPTTTPAFTVAGTSGGIPYFSSASTWASSAALAANALVIGGGAGAAPATTTTGTGILTALGVNTGTAGAPGILIASGAKALATSAISSAACSAAQTDTATGAATTDAIIASFNADPTAVTGYVPLTTGMLTIIAYPTSNTVNFKVCNNTASSITPGAITINWRIIR